MTDRQIHIVLKLSLSQPAQLNDFVSAFTSLANQYRKYMRSEHPNLNSEAEIYVKQIRQGSIVADLIPVIVPGLGAALAAMDSAIIVEDFIKRYGTRLSAYFEKGGRDDTANNSDLKDLLGSVATIANDPNGSAELSCVEWEDDHRGVRATITFNTREAKRATEEIDSHKKEREIRGDADYHRVLMTFHQSNIKEQTMGRRTGEWVKIENIQEKPLPLIYASSLAEQKIKYEIREGIENIYKRGFIVDVNVEIKGGKHVGYRVTHLHQIIDLPDEPGQT
jgi:hypothetical protein